MARIECFVLIILSGLVLSSAFLTSPHYGSLEARGRFIELRRFPALSPACRRLQMPAVCMMSDNEATKTEVSNDQDDSKTASLMDVMAEDSRDASEEASEDDADEGEAQVGSFRKRRAEKRRKASAGNQVSTELRFKLLEEQASPFRRFRQFIYLACVGSASIGTFIAGTRVIAGLQGISGVQPLEETIPNTAINAGVVIASAALWYFDEKRGQEALSELKEKSSSRTGLSELQVMDKALAP